MTTANTLSWDRIIGQYLQGNKPVARALEKAAAEACSVNASARINDLSLAMQQGRIDYNEWRAGMQAAVKQAHMASSALARGGFAEMRPGDWQRVEERLIFQYERLEAFARDLQRGRYGTPGVDGTMGSAPLHRATMYSDAARATYENERLAERREAGHTLARRELALVDNCPDCIEWADLGWIPLEEMEALYPIGASVCKTNCWCVIVTATEETAIRDAGQQAAPPPTAVAPEPIVPDSPIVREYAGVVSRVERLGENVQRIDTEGVQNRDRLVAEGQRLASEKQRLRISYELEIDSARRAALEAELKAVEARANELAAERKTFVKRIVKERKKAMDALRAEVEVESPIKIEAAITKGTPKEVRAVADEGIRGISRLISSDVADSLEVRVSHQAYGSTHYNPVNRMVQVGTGRGADVVVHELGHALEDQVSSVSEKAVAFFERRTAGETAQDLTQRFYAANDSRAVMVKIDNWGDDYVYAGRIYPSAESERPMTEIVSMGLQRMYQNPAQFLKDDPDYFEFIYNVARGR